METLQEIPDAPCCLRFRDCIVEVVQVQDQVVRSARLIRVRPD
jgi:Mg2+/Co2+ transporter CorB